MLIGFQRRRAWSFSALAASLETVAARLRRLQEGLRSDDAVIDVLRDLEDEDEIDESPDEAPPPIDRASLAAERDRVEGFVARARSLPNDATARSFHEAIKVILDLGRDCRARG